MSLDHQHRPAQDAQRPEAGADGTREAWFRRKKHGPEAAKQAAGRAGKAAAPSSTALAPVPAAPVPAPARPSPPPAHPGPAQPSPAQVEAEAARARAEALERAAKAERALARRRTARAAAIWARFAAFVLLPTILVGLYYYRYATDFYVSESAFVVKAADAPAPVAEGLLTGLATPGLTLQESISVQEFIESRQVLEWLERDLGLFAHFQDERIDLVRRLRPDATMEDAHDYYGSIVEVSYDPAESVIRMEVAAATPEMAQAISERLIGYSEEMVDGLSARLRADTLRGAEQAVALSKVELETAHVRVAELQQRLQVFSTEVTLDGEASIIHTLEMEVEALRGRLDELLTYAREDDVRVADLRRDIAFKRRQIAERQRNIVGDGAGGGGSLSAVNAELQRAQVEVLTQQQQFMSAMASLEAARIEAQRQIRYLAQVVPPSRADKSTRPERARNTGLAFVIFFGLFMMVSLTKSVLREQFSH